MPIPAPDADMPLLEPSEAVRILLGQIADKWTIVIMGQLCRGPLRFNALKRAVPGITQKALTQTLRRLERNGLVERRILPGSPPAVEYRGTELGFSLAPPMQLLFAWAVERLPDVEAAQGRYDVAEEDR